MTPAALVERMPRPKKNAGAKSADQGGDKPSAKYTEPVKLTKKFKEKLQDIAADASKGAGREVPMGEIIESQMAEWVNTQHLVVLRKKLAEAEAETEG